MIKSDFVGAHLVRMLVEPAIPDRFVSDR